MKEIECPQTDVAAKADGHTCFAAGEIERTKAWTATDMAAASGMVLSLLLADHAARAQLSALGAGHVLLLTPLFAVSSVYFGWGLGAEFAGVRLESFVVARWVDRVMSLVLGLLMIASSGAMLIRWASGSQPFPLALQLLWLWAPLALSAACSYALQGNGSSGRSSARGD